MTRTGLLSMVASLITIHGCRPTVGPGRDVVPSTDDKRVPLRFLGCRTDPPVDSTDAYIFPRNSDYAPLDIQLTVENGWLSWYPSPLLHGAIGADEAVVSIDTFEPVALRWDASTGGIARCSPATIVLAAPRTLITGRVHTPTSADASALVVGCGGHVTTPIGAEFKLPALNGNPCRIWARPVGASSWGAAVLVEPGSIGAEAVYISVTPPSIRRLGIDIAIAESKRGFEVTWIRGTSFHLGDGIVSIDGRVIDAGPDGLAMLAARLSILDSSHIIVVRRDDTDVTVTIEPGTTQHGLPLAPK